MDAEEVIELLGNELDESIIETEAYRTIAIGLVDTMANNIIQAKLNEKQAKKAANAAITVPTTNSTH